MILYIVIVSIMVIVLFISITDNSVVVDKSGNKNQKNASRFLIKTIFCFVMIFLCGITAFRSINIGNDTSVYVNYFTRIGQSGVNRDYEIELGYQYYCLFLSKICTQGNFILILTAIICYLGTGVYILKFSKNIMFSLILLFCTCFSIFNNTMRQDIAMIIVLYAYQLIKRRKYIIAALLILFASTFHTSALVAFLLYFHKFYPTKLRTTIIISFIIIVLAMSGQISSTLESVVEEYSGYFDSEYKGSGWLAVGYYFIRALIFYVIVNYAYRNQKREKSLELSNFLIFLILNCLGFTVNLFTRASEYFLLIGLVELPNALHEFKNDKRNVLIGGISIVSLAYFIVVLIVRPEWNHLYPYEFWFDLKLLNVVKGTISSVFIC